MDLSILIVTYGNPDMTEACLASVFEETSGVDFEVVLVDNLPGDGTAEMVRRRFPQVRLEQPGGNLGFAGGNNRAASLAVGEHVVLLNPDTIVHDGALVRLLEFCRGRPERLLAGGRTLRPDGRLDPSSCWGLPSLWSTFCFAVGASAALPRSRWLAPESLGGWERDSVREVGMVTGCLLMVRRDDWEALGGFDASFFMYGEDADLAIRARQAGLVPMITPAATITHVVGASSDPGGKRVLVMNARVALMRKHWPSGRFEVGRRLLLLGVALRAGGELAAARAPRSVSGWREVWRRRSEWRDGVLRS